jgi:L-threonylcarbamoyladenylate synthase
MLKSHYAPRTRLVIHKQGELASLPLIPKEGRLYFSLPHNSADAGAAEKPREKNIKVLSVSGDLREAAANLFEMLHELDSLGLGLIRAEEAPCTGLGEAINDRLRRAGSKS